jgi:serine/threonine protein kinase
MHPDAIHESPYEARLQEILLAYVEAAEVGNAPDLESFIAAHREFASEIRDFLTSYRQVNQLATPLRHCGEQQLALHFLQSPGAGGPRGRSTEGTDCAAPLAGELGQIGDYRLLREIGRGGMGVVYEAEQLSLRRRVALKILPFAGGVDSRQLQRFRNEAEAAAHLHHSHIVPVFAVGAERGVHFYAMQYIEGQSLAALIADLAAARRNQAADGSKPAKGNAAPSTEVALALETDHSAHTNRFFRRLALIGLQTAEALEYAHQMGVVHRDIKPANLLLDSRGEVWITDFGLAQFQNHAGLTVTGELVGTLRYVSPEQALAGCGLVDYRTDIYSLGATLYELLTLKPVLDGKDRHALLHQIAFDEPKSPRQVDPSIPVELEIIILKALAKTPGDRYGSAQELADDLNRFLEDKPIQAKRPTLAERGRKWLRRHPAVVVGAVLFLLMGVIASTVSAVLIAREQWKTEQAYGKLRDEEKQTKDAYVKLALEEKRTKTAFAELAKEQKRTEAALKAEAEERDRAEADYQQAREALDVIVRFSEGELAHHPAYQDVRRRLLETVLDYYEDFLTRHEANASAAAELIASHERAAAILTELASLRGPSLLTVMQAAPVQEDLKLDDAQKGKIKQVVEGFKGFNRQRQGPVEKMLRPFPAVAGIDKALGEVLTPTQKTRLGQILLQVQQQGRHAFSDPHVGEALHLTKLQRAEMRRIQNDIHRAWVDHVFSDKKLARPSDFWADAQAKILAVLQPAQREQWEKMIGVPVAIDLREGYPFDGQDVRVPKPGPSFPVLRGCVVAVSHGRNCDFVGSGFGHKRYLDDKQYYSWRGQEIPPTAFEVAVTTQPLNTLERQIPVGNDDLPRPPRSPDAPAGWVVLFRSLDPSVWNTDSPEEKRFALPVTKAHPDIRYLKLTRLDTGEAQIVPIRHADLTQHPGNLRENEFGWEGSAQDIFGARHLGIARGPIVRRGE